MILSISEHQTLGQRCTVKLTPSGRSEEWQIS